MFAFLQNYFPPHLLDSENSDKAVTEKAQKAKTILHQVRINVNAVLSSGGEGCRGDGYFPILNIALIITLCKTVPTFESLDKVLWCDHSDESYRAVLSCGAVYYAVQGGSNF